MFFEVFEQLELDAPGVVIRLNAMASGRIQTIYNLAVNVELGLSIILLP
ncbi:hypothetical protein NB231_09713 [Nitrococcus mobilis Nb-231]|uniref:Uncharacterized protein n=1 Tax=Nitrococcus mobilis Nb-231 TaxID=314278 RepID=A4BNC0_9GAMM|nr:hypothetical protein NB231_09713 [Nitrococcus mobilis Nb-231]